MTRQELEAALEEIGWRIHKSGNGLNDYIVNDYGENTCFVVRGENMLEVRRNLFGATSFTGCCNFELSTMSISKGSSRGSGDIEYISLDFNKNCYIQFFKKHKK